MKTKLTLSVDKDLVRLARDQARSDGMSISGMFSEFIRKSQPQQRTVPSVTAMVGTLKQYAIDDSKLATRASYAKKYLN